MICLCFSNKIHINIIRKFIQNILLRAKNNPLLFKILNLHLLNRFSFSNRKYIEKDLFKDIAKDLNVSKTAVSLVLNNNKGNENKISQDTQKKILEYAKKHNYAANSLYQRIK